MRALEFITGHVIYNLYLQIPTENHPKQRDILCKNHKKNDMTDLAIYFTL